MTSIVKYNRDQSLSLMRISEEFFKSGIFPNVKNAAGAFAIIHYGYELGVPPMASLQTMSIVKGKVCMSAAAMLTLAQSKGVTYDILKEDETKCEIKFAKDDKVYMSSFTIQEAKQAGLIKEESAWEKYPKDLLFCRAVTRGLRRICPEAVLGLYSPEELSSLKEEVKVVSTPESKVEPSTEDEVITGQEVAEPSGGDKLLVGKNYGYTGASNKDGLTGQEVIGQEGKGVSEQDVKDTFKESGIEGGEAYTTASDDPASNKEDMITDPQIKAIRTILSSKGIDAFYINFKYYLKRINLLKNVDTIKSMTKNAASELLSDIDGHLVSFFTLGEYHEEMKRVFNFLAKGTKVKILMTLTYFVKDIDSLPKKITEDLSDEYANNYFELFLKAIANQNDGKLPVEHWGGKEDGVLPHLVDKNSPVAMGASIDEHFSEKEKVKPEFGF